MLRIAERRNNGLGIFGMTRRRRETGRLGERFGQDDAGNQRITREMTGEHRIIRGKGRHSLRGNTGIAPDQLAHENKGRAMREAEERMTSDR